MIVVVIGFFDCPSCSSMKTVARRKEPRTSASTRTKPGLSFGERACTKGETRTPTVSEPFSAPAGRYFGSETTYHIQENRTQSRHPARETTSTGFSVVGVCLRGVKRGHAKSKSGMKNILIFFFWEERGRTFKGKGAGK